MPWHRHEYFHVVLSSLRMPFPGAISWALLFLGVSGVPPVLATSACSFVFDTLCDMANTFVSLLGETHNYDHTKY